MSSRWSIVGKPVTACADMTFSVSSASGPDPRPEGHEFPANIPDPAATGRSTQLTYKGDWEPQVTGSVLTAKMVDFELAFESGLARIVPEGTDVGSLGMKLQKSEWKTVSSAAKLFREQAGRQGNWKDARGHPTDEFSRVYDVAPIVWNESARQYLPSTYGTSAFKFSMVMSGAQDLNGTIDKVIEDQEEDKSTVKVRPSLV